MARYRSSRIFPVILIMVIVVIAIVALISLTRAIFFSGDSGPTITDTSRQELLSTTASHSVRMTVRGPIVANEEFRSYEITITPSSRSLVTYKGYTDQRIDSINLSNNVRSYEQFVYALDKAEMTKGTQLTGEQDDLRGICAVGQVYNFEILNNKEPVKELWTSTCSGSKGSLKASAEQLMELFQNQIPDSQDLIRAIDLS